MTLAAPVLRTPRLRLRPLTAQDIPDIVSGVGNYDVSKWLAVVPYPYQPHHAAEFIANVDASGPEAFYWAITDDSGFQGLISIDGELGFWLARSAWGQGYGFEAAAAAVEFWFSDPARDTLVAGHFDGNDRSGTVLRALGFRLLHREERHARAYDQKVMSNRLRLTREGWQARHAFHLTTNRLTVRPLTAGDVDAILPLGDISVARQTASVTADWTRSEADSWLRARLWQGRASGMFGVFTGGQLVGAVGAGGHPANAGWMILPAHWGHGYATEAMRAFLPAFFARTTLSHVVAEIFEDNPASTAVARKLGFIPTGRATGTSRARLEPAPIITYALSRDRLKDRP